jgi:SM-20-related protein
MNWDATVNQLEKKQFVICDDFLNFEEITALIDDFQQRRNAGQFKSAGIGKGLNSHLNILIRNDETLWFESEQLTPAQKNLWNKLGQLKDAINSHFFMGLWHLEGHYAWYPAGGKYDAHLDRFSNDDARTISMVLYLNPDWKKGDGGELRIHREKENLPPLDVEPIAGRLVCFFSADVLHEVLPSTKPRMSFAGWWKRRTSDLLQK